jgi:YidC/Oxa1 family membrane protein insertase
MNLLSQFFHSFIYQPLLYFLVFIYNILPYKDLGLAVIILTVLIRLILLPSNIHSLKTQKKLAELQPEIEKIQKKYKNNKEKQAQELFKLYQKQKVNPFSSIISLIIQIPILIGLYRVFLNGYQDFNSLFLGSIDLSQPSLAMAFVAAITQFIQGKLIIDTKQQIASFKSNEFQKIFQKQITYFLPLFTFFILLKLPSVLALYFFTSNIFTIFQQYFILKEEHIK